MATETPYVLFLYLCDFGLLVDLSVFKFPHLTEGKIAAPSGYCGEVPGFENTNFDSPPYENVGKCLMITVVQW